MLSGNIHEELEVTNELPIGEAMVKMAYALYDMGKAFAQEVPNVEMIVMPGNHPRLERKPRMKNAWNNWEWVMGMFIQALARDQFNVIVPKDLVYRHKAFKQVIGLTHGDGVKAQAFAGIPWYSMKQRRDAMQALLKSLGLPQLDLLIYGHFHQLIYEEGSGCGLLINGSIKGYDEFILKLKTKYSGQTPIQALLTFHPRHGLTDLSRINLGHVRSDESRVAA
jgi:predicted phosphodiesterase